MTNRASTNHSVSNRYGAYGLVFESELPLPEFSRLDHVDAYPSDTAADVQIRLASVPEHLDEVVGSGVLFEANPREFLLKMPDVASYLVRDGNEILVSPAPEATDNEVRVFMLGSCVGALLHQREALVLHAAAIGTERGAVLFAGISGVGKSTLLGELTNRGHAMMVDDVCAVVPDPADEHAVRVMPGYPRTRLWADAAKKLEVDTTDLDRTRPSLEKFERQIPEQFWNEPATFRKLYILSTHNKDEIVLEQLPAVRSFAAVLHNTYRRTFLEGLAMRKPHFALASAVAQTVPIVRVLRPSAGFRLTDLADRIEADLEADLEGDIEVGPQAS